MPFQRCAEGLGGVFDDGRLCCGGERIEGVHVGALAVEMDGHDGELVIWRGVLLQRGDELRRARG